MNTPPRPTIVTTTRVHSLPDGELMLLGAHSSVTGAMTRIVMGSTKVLVDCGVAQGDEARDWEFNDAALDVDAVLLTHGHNDHVGSLPTLLERGYAGPIYGTPATLAIAEVVLEDGLRIQGHGSQYVSRMSRDLKHRLRPLRYDTPDRLGDVEFAYREAGHILGSASVELVSPASRVICSGDLGRPDSPILRDYNMKWRAERPVDLVVMESTYGDGEHRHSHDDIEKELERLVKRAIDRKGHILIPAFAIGRTQTVLHHLNTLVSCNASYRHKCKGCAPEQSAPLRQNSRGLRPVRGRGILQGTSVTGHWLKPAASPQSPLSSTAPWASPSPKLTATFSASSIAKPSPKSPKATTRSTSRTSTP